MAKSILILEHGFLKPRSAAKQLHGVELFRLNLIRELLARGIEITIVAERSWKPIILERTAGAGREPRLVLVPHLGPPVTAAVGAVMAAGGHYDVALFGNARKSLIVAMHLVHASGIADRLLLFAHREPGASFCESVNSIPFDTVVNSDMVAAHYRGLVPGRLEVFYGLTNAHVFHARDDLRSAPTAEPGIINFVLLAKLPNISKGLGKMLECFAQLPPSIRERARLHLASFVTPVEITAPGVVTYPWLPAGKIPDLLRGMDIMLCLSSHETFSQAIVQGMLTELPVVATPLPVYTEKLDTGAGFVCRTDDEIVRAMTELAEDPDLRRRMGAEGRRVALERYVWSTDAFIERFLFPADAGRREAETAGVDRL